MNQVGHETQDERMGHAEMRLGLSVRVMLNWDGGRGWGVGGVEVRRGLR